MADSEERQKFGEIADFIVALYGKSMNETGRWSAREAIRARLEYAYSAGMRAGETAQREKIIKAVCTGCRLGWPEQGRPGHGIVIHVPPDPRGLYACQAVAIRALPLSGAEESKKEKA